MSDDFTGATHRQLQQLAKGAGLLATGKTAELRQRLIDHRAQCVGGPYQDIRIQGSKNVDRAALLRVAAGTPLPNAKSPDQGRADQERRSSEGNTQRCLAQLADSATTTSCGTLLVWLLIAAVTAVVLALMLPYCKHCNCPALARSLPELVTEAAAATYSQLRVQALAATDVVQAYWTALLSTRAGNHAGLHCHFNALALLHAVMGSKMEAAQVATAAMLTRHGMEPPNKAAVVLFVCQTDADCHLAVKAVSAALVDQRCVLHLQGQHLSTDKGALQHELANQLLAAPESVVVLSRMDLLSPALLPVLINGMSEQGSFQQDGRAIPTAGATFILTSVMSTEPFELLSEEMAFTRNVKKQLVVDLTQRAGTADKEAANVQAKALRRRIDVVLPVSAAR